MIVADTHALIWWINEPRNLSARAREAIDASPLIGVSSITCFEVARLAARNRITIDVGAMDWLQNVLALDRITLLPVSVDIAVEAGYLPDSVRDPADRIIVATARHHGVPLVTKDGRIAASQLVPTVW